MTRYAEPPPDLITYVKKLEKRIENLERSQRITNTSLDSGSVTVNNGHVVSKHPNGVELFRTGTGETTLPFEVTPTQGYVTRIRRASGQRAFEVFSSTDGSEAKGSIHDREGNEILGDDWLTGRGLNRPWIPLRVHKVSEWFTPPDIVTSGTFTGVYLIEGNIQHPAIAISIRCVADSGTAGEIRMRDTFFSHTMWSDTITTAMNGTFDAIGNIHILRGYGDTFSVEIQARRTAGTGNIRLGVTQCYNRSAAFV